MGGKSRERRVYVKSFLSSAEEYVSTHKETSGVGRSQCLYNFHKDRASHLVPVVDIDS